MSPRKLLSLVAVVLVLALAYWAWSVFQPSSTSSERSEEKAAGGTIEDRLDRLLAAQQEQAARLDRLEAAIAGRRPGLDSHGPAIGAAGHGHANENEPVLSAADVNRRLEEALRQEQVKFLSEPASGPWAAKSQELIAEAFDPSSLSSMNAPIPSTQSAVCRGMTCQIEAVYADQVQADIGQAFLLSDIASRMPKARTYNLMQPDGSVRLIVFAHTGRVRR